MNLKRRLYLAMGIGVLAMGAQEAPAGDLEESTPLVVEVHVQNRPSSTPGGQTLHPELTTGGNTLDILKQLPGFAALRGGGASGLPVLDGFAASDIVQTVDGIRTPTACANGMNPPLSYVSPNQIGQIHVYPTVAPVSVGGNAMGGAIAVESPKALFASGQNPVVGGRVGSFYQSNGNIHGGSAAIYAATRTTYVRYDGAVSAGSDYRAAAQFKPAIPGIPGNIVGSTQYLSSNQSLQLAHKSGANFLDLHLNYQYIPYQAFPNARMDMTKNESVGINLHFTHDYGWGKWSIRAYQEHILHRMNFLADKMIGASMDMPMQTNAVHNGLRSELRLNLDPEDTLEVGAGYDHEDLDDRWPPARNLTSMPMAMQSMGPLTFVNLNHARQDDYHVYAQWHRDWSAHWSSLVGLRGDFVEQGTGPVQGYNAMMYGNPDLATSQPGVFNAAHRRELFALGSLSFVTDYRPNAQWELELGLSRRSQAPGLYERYAWSSQAMAMLMNGWFGDGNGYIGNLALQPQTANTASLSLQWQSTDKGWELRIQPHYSYIEHYIGVQRCPVTLGGACTPANLTATSGFVYLQFQNQRAALYGVDFRARMPVLHHSTAGDWDLETAGSYTRGDNLALHTPLYEIAPPTLRLALVQHWGAFTNRMEETLVAAQNRVDPTRNEPRTGAYALLDLATEYGRGPWQASLRLQNLLNRLYFDPLGSTYLGQRPFMAGTPVPGPGRSVQLAVSYTF
jgi:iron complex outermembrane receptor protein